MLVQFALRTLQSRCIRVAGQDVSWCLVSTTELRLHVRPVGHTVHKFLTLGAMIEVLLQIIGYALAPELVLLGLQSSIALSDPAW